MSFECLIICLRERAITARCREDYAALGDMAHGASMAVSPQKESDFLVQVREAAREMENIAPSRA